MKLLTWFSLIARSLKYNFYTCSIYFLMSTAIEYSEREVNSLLRFLYFNIYS